MHAGARDRAETRLKTDDAIERRRPDNRTQRPSRDPCGHIADRSRAYVVTAMPLARARGTAAAVVGDPDRQPSQWRARARRTASSTNCCATTAILTFSD